MLFHSLRLVTKYLLWDNCAWNRCNSLLRLCWWFFGDWAWRSGLLLPDSVSSELTDTLCCLLGRTAGITKLHQTNPEHARAKCYPQRHRQRSNPLTPDQCPENNSVLLDRRCSGSSQPGGRTEQNSRVQTGAHLKQGPNLEDGAFFTQSHLKKKGFTDK